MTDKLITVSLDQHNGYWRARYYASGKRKQRTLGNAAKVGQREAQRRAKQLEIELNMGDARPDASNAKPDAAPAITLSQWANAYMAQWQPGAEKTRRLMQGSIDHLLAYFGTSMALADVRHLSDDGGPSMALFEQWLAQQPTHKGTLPAKATVASHIRRIAQMLGAAVDADLIRRNPCGKLRRNAAPPEKDWALVSHRDIATVIRNAPTDGWRLLWALCRFAGCRRNEALDLQWQDLDLPGNQVTWLARLEAATTKKRKRLSPIEPPAAPTGLLDMLERAAAAAEARHGRAWLTQPVCEGVGPNNIDRDAVAQLRRTIGRYAKPFHTLRKNRRTELDAVYPEAIVNEWLGQSSEVARKHYRNAAHLDDTFGRPAKTDAPELRLAG